MEGPHGSGFVLSDCHSNSSSVPHLVIPPLKRRHKLTVILLVAAYIPFIIFTINWKLLGIQDQALLLWVEEGQV